MLTKEHKGALWSPQSSRTPCISAFSTTAHSGIMGTELKNRNNFNNCSSPKVSKLNYRKSIDSHKEGHFFPAALSKVTLSDKTSCSQHLPKNGMIDGPELYSETSAHHAVEWDFSEHLLCNEKPNKIPVSWVKPHPKVTAYSKPPSTSFLLKASVQQKQSRKEQVTSRGRFELKSSSAHGPQNSKQEHDTKQNAAQVQRVLSPATRPTFCQGPSCQPSNVSTLEEGFSFQDDNTRKSKKMKGKKHRSKDHVIQLNKQTPEKGTKPGMFQDRVSFDPETVQIVSSFNEESREMQDFSSVHKVESQASTEQSKFLSTASHCPFQQTDWKMLARSEIIQSYLSQQSSVLASSGARTPGGHFFMTECLKKEGQQSQGDCKRHTLEPEVSPEELPGINREITTEDLKRLHTHRWAGVNGCYDTKGQWFDWSECISLDPQGDESKLNILPYVCLD